MKKIFYLLLISLLLPIFVHAEAFLAKDLTIEIDDTHWYVFTRANLYNNQALHLLPLL